MTPAFSFEGFELRQDAAGPVRTARPDGRVQRCGRSPAVEGQHREHVEQAHEDGVELFVPAKPARNPEKRGRELEPRKGDSEAVRRWKQRMASEEGKEIYRQRAATSETVNADLRTYRGLGPINVRGLSKARCVALWCALAYNVLHFGRALLSG